MTGVRDLGLPQGNPLALPRGGTAAATVSDAPQILQPTGDILVTDSSNYVSYLTPVGRTLGSNTAIFRVQAYVSANKYLFCGVTYSDSGLTSVLTPANFGATATVWNTWNYHNSWSTDDSIYFYASETETIYRISITGSQIVNSTAKTTPIPSTGTLTVGGTSYSVTNGTTYVAGQNNSATGSISVSKLPGGQILVVRAVIQSGTAVILAGFVLDSSFNIVRSFPIVTAFNGTSLNGVTFLVLPVKNSADTFSVFSIGMTTATNSARASAATFSASTGGISVSSISGFSLATSTWGQSGIDVGKGFVRISYNNGGATRTTNEVIFPVNEDFSFVSSTLTNRSILTANTNFPYLTYYDPDFDDMVTITAGSGSTPNSEFIVPATGTGYFSPLLSAPVVQKITTLKYSNVASSGTFGVRATKAILAAETDPSISTLDTGQGPFSMVRVGEKSFVSGYSDVTTGNNYKISTQLFKGV